jgi:hypothetical protein
VLDYIQVVRDAKVRKLYVPTLGYENIRCLEVGVHGAVVVKVFQSLENLSHTTRN